MKKSIVLKLIHNKKNKATICQLPKKQLPKNIRENISKFKEVSVSFKDFKI